ncbi:MAG TPA: hypothetical protein VG713_14955 [Pirellulales bacterium]|nr:hypothetical protein [Pirellulales bacterium]
MTCLVGCVSSKNSEVCLSARTNAAPNVAHNMPLRRNLLLLTTGVRIDRAAQSGTVNAVAIAAVASLELITITTNDGAARPFNRLHGGRRDMRSWHGLIMVGEFALTVVGLLFNAAVMDEAATSPKGSAEKVPAPLVVTISGANGSAKPTPSGDGAELCLDRDRHEDHNVAPR